MKQLSIIDSISEYQEVTSDIFDYRPSVFSKADCERYLRVFLYDTPWVQTSQLMYGKTVTTARLTAWYGDPNTDYSVEGTGSPTLPWTPELLEIKEKVEAISGIQFNSVLLNYYRDQNDSVAWHSDRDGVPGRNKYVASVSFGQERMFDLRMKDDPTKAFSVLLEDGSYLLMKGEFQDKWQHRIAKSRLAMGPRINLTYRISSNNMSNSENTADDLTEWLTREQHWKAIHAQLVKTRAALDDMFRLYMANAGDKPTTEMKRYYLNLVDQELEARTGMNDFIFARV